MRSKLFVLAFVVALFMVSGCACSDDVKKKVSTECAVHDGYVRTIKAGVKEKDGTVRPVTRDELILMVLLSRKGWYGASHYLFNTPAPDEKYESLDTALGAK